MPAVPLWNFRLPKHLAIYRHLPSARTTTRDRSNDFQGWTIYADGVTRVVDGDRFWVRCYGRRDLMFGLVFTTEAHLSQVPERTPTTQMK